MVRKNINIFETIFDFVKAHIDGQLFLPCRVTITIFIFFINIHSTLVYNYMYVGMYVL